ncbi:MAG: hypothetical protein J3K34DRAFT_456082 [Monoraphidium minutum]|nr:MAG: hypothetical protein J3K34DRAFT_456082 [Monoraphidium minutum]
MAAAAPGAALPRPVAEFQAWWAAKLGGATPAAPSGPRLSHSRPPQPQQAAAAGAAASSRGEQACANCAAARLWRPPLPGAQRDDVWPWVPLSASGAPRQIPSYSKGRSLVLTSNVAQALLPTLYLPLLEEWPVDTHVRFSPAPGDAAAAAALAAARPPRLVRSRIAFGGAWRTANGPREHALTAPGGSELCRVLGVLGGDHARRRGAAGAGARPLPAGTAPPRLRGCEAPLQPLQLAALEGVPASGAAAAAFGQQEQDASETQPLSVGGWQSMGSSGDEAQGQGGGGREASTEVLEESSGGGGWGGSYCGGCGECDGGCGGCDGCDSGGRGGECGGGGAAAAAAEVAAMAAVVRRSACIGAAMEGRGAAAAVAARCCRCRRGRRPGTGRWGGGSTASGHDRGRAAVCGAQAGAAPAAAAACVIRSWYDAQVSGLEPRTIPLRVVTWQSNTAATPGCLG